MHQTNTKVLNDLFRIFPKKISRRKGRIQPTIRTPPVNKQNLNCYLQPRSFLSQAPKLHNTIQNRLDPIAIQASPGTVARRKQFYPFRAQYYRDLTIEPRRGGLEVI